MVLTLWMLGLLLHLAATAPLRLDVLPASTVRPLDSWHLRVWVERDDTNRALRVEAHGADYDRLTDVPLEGSNASRLHEIWWNGRVPCGHYLVAASVLGVSDRLLAQTRKQATICAQVEGP